MIKFTRQKHNKLAFIDQILNLISSKSACIISIPSQKGPCLSQGDSAQIPFTEWIALKKLIKKHQQLNNQGIKRICCEIPAQCAYRRSSLQYLYERDECRLAPQRISADKIHLHKEDSIFYPGFKSFSVNPMKSFKLWPINKATMDERGQVHGFGRIISWRGLHTMDLISHQRCIFQKIKLSPAWLSQSYIKNSISSCYYMGFYCSINYTKSKAASLPTYDEIITSQPCYKPHDYCPMFLAHTSALSLYDRPH